MSDDEGQTRSQPQASTAGQIDTACDHFERAWGQGPRPRIEDYLGRVSQDAQPRLFRELLEIELSLRQRQAESLHLEQYRQRFPDYAEIAEFVFRKVVRRRLGDYELLEEIGHGGMGLVYKARQVRLNQMVALKVLPERCLGDSQAVSRFKREMQSVGGLEHANIVRAYNAGEEKGVHFLVMELVDGVNLQGLMARHGALPVGAACEIIRQAAMGLQHAHEHGLVHRDIKPANLMLSRTGTVKILDLGLARFQADPLTQELTQPGVAMGTVDYMAPEQWENSSAVDIRADIYSLGCTLFFLLTGQPPYGNQSYDTPRKKLAAHMAAPIPSLAALRQDCPEDLDALLARMLAKDAEDRFSTPGEAADAIEPFAEPAAVPPLLPFAGTTNDLLITVPETPVKPASKRPGSSSRRTLRKPWYRRAPVLAAGGLLAALLAALIVWQAWPHRPSAQEQLVCDLYTLPGLNCLGAPGGWWFEETPWLTPFARRAIVERLLDPQQGSDLLADRTEAGNPAMNPNTAEARRWLKGLLADAEMSSAQSRLLESLLDLSQQSLDAGETAGLLRGCLNRFQFDHAEVESWNAVDLHSRAVLEHKLALIDGSPQMVEQARQSYQQALKAYDEAGRPLAPLRALCLVDLGWLYSQRIDDYGGTMQCFDQAAALRNASPCFQAQVLASRGVAACAAENYEEGDRALEGALKILEPSHWSEVSHPLVAHVHERYAWSLVYQWKVEGAIKHFHEAFAIRTRWKASNELAEVYVLHNLHGIALGERYRGNLDWARTKFDDVLEQVGEDLRHADKAAVPVNQRRYRTLLRERRCNSAERRADCELYQGAASGTARVSLDDACRNYQIALQAASDGDVAVGAGVGFKLAIALALKNLPEAARTGRKELARGDAQIAGKALGPEKKRLHLLRRIADAVLTRHEAGLVAGQEKLRRILQDLHGTRLSAKEKDRCEIQELYLFCAEMLLASAIKEKGLPADQGDLNNLGALLAAFPEARELREPLCPYLRRYYELAVEAAGEGDPSRIAGYVLFSRCEERPDDATTLVFFFQGEDSSLRQRKNLAIAWSPSGKCEVYPLDFDRAAILHPAPGQTFALPPGLLQFVRDDRQRGHACKVSWNDEVCWYLPADTITDEHWPFKELALDPLKARQTKDKAASAP